MISKNNKNSTAVKSAILMLTLMVSLSSALENGVARTPPMGWNTWNVFRENFNEDLIKETADLFVSTGLADAGYVYIVIDNGWAVSGNYYQPNTSKFPSGMKSLSDYLHGKGLKFGLYTRWESQGYEERDVNQWAEWEVDYMKYDAWRSYSTDTWLWTDMRDAILAIGYPMVYSVHFQDRTQVIGNPDVMNMWRFTNDMIPYYHPDDKPGDKQWGQTTLEVIDDMERVIPTTGPGCWADADMLILLTNAPGLCHWQGQEPLEGLEPLPFVEKITPEIKKMARGPTDPLGTGGMITKLEAAQLATQAGLTAVIAHGKRDNTILDIVQGKPVGTLFAPQEDRLTHKKHWIAYSLNKSGTLLLDDGAVNAIVNKGTSLLPSGIMSVEGRFEGGEMVSCIDNSGKEWARGLAHYNAEEIKKIAGKKSSQIESILGYKITDEVIHRDELAVLKD